MMDGLPKFKSGQDVSCAVCCLGRTSWAYPVHSKPPSTSNLAINGSMSLNLVSFHFIFSLFINWFTGMHLMLHRLVLL